MAGLTLGYLQLVGGLVLAVALVTLVSSRNVRNDERNACAIERVVMETAADAYRQETGAYPTSRSQVEASGLVTSESLTNFDYAADGSGQVVAAADSACD